MAYRTVESHVCTQHGHGPSNHSAPPVPVRDSDPRHVPRPVVDLTAPRWSEPAGLAAFLCLLGLALAALGLHLAVGAFADLPFSLRPPAAPAGGPPAHLLTFSRRIL